MAHDLSYLRPSTVWRRMSPERRLTVAELFWLDEDSADIQAEAIAAISAHMKFRTKSVLGLPAEKLAKYLATLPTVSDSIASRALVSYHLERQRPMMGAFLDLLGITHDNGLIRDTDVQKPDESTLRAAATELASRYPAEDVSLYFATLVAQDPDTWGELADVPEMAVGAGSAPS